MVAIDITWRLGYPDGLINHLDDLFSCTRTVSWFWPSECYARGKGHETILEMSQVITSSMSICLVIVAEFSTFGPFSSISLSRYVLGPSVQSLLNPFLHPFSLLIMGLGPKVWRDGEGILAGKGTPWTQGAGGWFGIPSPILDSPHTSWVLGPLMSTCHSPFVSRIADTAYIASVEMRMQGKECIVIVLYLCVPRGPLGFGKGL